MTTISTLPDDIIYQVSLYLDCVKYRNGKYIYRIDKNDIRYEILNTIDPPEVGYINNSQYNYYVSHRMSLEYKRHDIILAINYYFDYSNDTIMHINKYELGKIRNAHITHISTEQYLINRNGNIRTLK